ncbi:hypothetical protein AB6A40_007094 [Gnathostoma spinigerum]|uniref:Pepsin inhibitor-3-like repeated domain-containing protein n=1 Tax=Gnathostoma spinigerum TaxID=75299 RepID=A0ABD6EVV4_9BILA
MALTAILGDVSGDAFINFDGHSCVIQNGRLFVNGVDKGPFKQSEQMQYALYRDEVRKWSAALNKSIQDVYFTVTDMVSYGLLW